VRFVQQTPDLTDGEEARGSDAVFGQAVALARQERGWSQRQLASELQAFGLRLDPSAVTRIETGARAVRLHEAVALSDALDLSLDVAARWFPDDEAVQFAAYERLVKRSLQRARRELVRALRFADAAVNVVVDDERVLAERGVSSFVQLWDNVATAMERSWSFPDPVIGEMFSTAEDEADAEVAGRIASAVVAEIVYLPPGVRGDPLAQPSDEEASNGEHPETS
jgi:transcriptional regulator with XRE-family HTH domain